MHNCIHLTEVGDRIRKSEDAAMLEYADIACMPPHVQDFKSGLCCKIQHGFGLVSSPSEGLGGQERFPLKGAFAIVVGVDKELRV